MPKMSEKPEAGLYGNAHASKIIKIAKRCDWHKLNTNLAAVESLRRVALAAKERMHPIYQKRMLAFIAEEKRKFGYIK